MKQKRKTGAIYFNLYDSPSREKVREVLDYIGIPEDGFIHNTTEIFNKYRNEISKLKRDECIVLIDMVSVEKTKELSQDHLKAIDLIAGELVGRFLGYAIITYAKKGLISPETLAEILARHAKLFDDKNKGI